MDVLSDFGMFLYGYLKMFVGWFVWWFLVYQVFHFVGFYLMAGRNKSEYKKLKSFFSGSCLNLLMALKQVTDVVYENAKLYKDEKMEKIRNRKRNIAKG